jgi:hypothetical protein
VKIGVHRILRPAVLHHLHLGLHVLGALAGRCIQGVHRRGFRDGLLDGGLDSRQIVYECGQVRRIVKVGAVTRIVTAAEGGVPGDRA